MGKAMGEAYDAAAQLKKAEQDLEDAMELQEIQSAKNRAEINRYNIMAKDRTKTEEERLELLRKAAAIEKMDFDQRKANAAEQLRVAEQQIINEAKLTAVEIAELQKRGFAYKDYVEKKTNNTDELFDKLKEAQLAQIDIDNEYYSNMEKNINKQNKLQEDAEAAAQKREEQRKKRLADILALSQAELDLYISQQGTRAKSAQEELNIAEEIRKKRLKIAQDEYNASEKTQADKLKLLTEQNNIQNEFLQKNADIAVKNAARELDILIKANASKIDSQKFFTEAALQEEKRRLDRIAEINETFQATQLALNLINEQEYQDAITAIQEDTRIKKEEAQKLRDEAEKERKAIDLENQLLIDEELFQNNLNTQLQRLDVKRQAEIDAAVKTNADLELINKKYALAKDALERKSKETQVANAQSAIGEIGQLAQGFFGENKLLAAALASVDAILGAQKAFVSQLIPGDPTSMLRATLAAVKAGAFGALNVAKVSGVKFAEGGELFGPSHSNGGIPFTIAGKPGFEAEGGESIINKKSTSMFKPLLSYLNVLGGGKPFASGGVASLGAVSTAIPKVDGIDYDLLASKLADANRLLPPPVMDIETFNYKHNEYADIVNGASHE